MKRTVWTIVAALALGAGVGCKDSNQNYIAFDAQVTDVKPDGPATDAKADTPGTDGSTIDTSTDTSADTSTDTSSDAGRADGTSTSDSGLADGTSADSSLDISVAVDGSDAEPG